MARLGEWSSAAFAPFAGYRIVDQIFRNQSLFHLPLSFRRLSTSVKCLLFKKSIEECFETCRVLRSHCCGFPSSCVADALAQRLEVDEAFEWRPRRATERPR